MFCVSVGLRTCEIKHLDHHFMKPGDSEKISDSSILHFVQNLGVLNLCIKGLHIRSKTVDVHGSLQCLLYVLYSFLSQPHTIKINYLLLSKTFILFCHTQNIINLIFGAVTEKGTSIQAFKMKPLRICIFLLDTVLHFFHHTVTLCF
jgi:hypothetical protein